MTTFRVQWVLHSDNANPADDVMNTWHFKNDDSVPPEDIAPDIVARIAPFYDDLAAYYSSFISGASSYKVFDLADPEPRVPILEGVESMSGVSAGNGLPCEVSVCLSYQAERLSGKPQARRRGRLYIGPLSMGAPALVADAGAGDMIVTSAFRADLAQAATDVAGVFFGGGGSAVAWCTFSPTDVADGATIAAASNNVTDGWVDFAVDIQRRRGHAPGGRTLWSA